MVRVSSGNEYENILGFSKIPRTVLHNERQLALCLSGFYEIIRHLQRAFVDNIIIKSNVNTTKYLSICV